MILICNIPFIKKGQPSSKIPKDIQSANIISYYHPFWTLHNIAICPSSSFNQNPEMLFHMAKIFPTHQRLAILSGSHAFEAHQKVLYFLRVFVGGSRNQPLSRCYCYWTWRNVWCLMKNLKGQIDRSVSPPYFCWGSSLDGRSDYHDWMISNDFSMFTTNGFVTTVYHLLHDMICCQCGTIFVSWVALIKVNCSSSSKAIYREDSP